MKIDEALFAHLTTAASPGVEALVGKRMYPDQVPQKTDYPAIGYAIVDGEPDYTHDGLSTYAVTRFELVCLARTSKGAKQLAEAVRLALTGWPATMGGAGGVEVFAAFIEDETHDFDDELRVYWATLDVRLEHAQDTA